VWPLAALGFTTGAAFEIGRKLRAPEDELTGVDSYTKALGVRSATVGLALATLFSAALTVVLVSNVAPTSRVPYVLVVVGSLSAVVSGVRFARTPSSETANAANNGVALAHLASYAALLVAVIAERGVAWA
jgi:4-hydroxybenzoate polyprenyltransferase